MTTGQRIRAARKKQGVTQAQLAKILNLPYQSIGQWERDIRNPKLGTLMRIAEALDISIDDLTDDLPVEETKMDPKGARRAQQHASAEDLILEILKLQYGAAERKELCYHGTYQDYFLVGSPPDQFYLHSADMDLLVRAIPSLFERIKDPRPVEEILSEELDKLKSQSEYLVNLLKEE